MAKYKKGDVVICIKFDVGESLVCGKDKIKFKRYIDTTFFNREAVIEETVRECCLRHGEPNPKDEEKYSIRFIDTDEELAWVRGEELIRKEFDVWADLDILHKEERE